MKFTLPKLRVGDQVKARIEEILDRYHVIANFKGDLLRISNHTRLAMKVGQVVTLEVQEINPLKFRLADQKNRRGIDLLA